MYTCYIYHETSSFYIEFLAQSVEHQTFNREVRGSSPSTGITFPLVLWAKPRKTKSNSIIWVERRYHFLRCMETHLASVDHILMSVRCQMSDVRWQQYSAKL